MYKSKLYQLLRTFGEQDWKDCATFLKQQRGEETDEYLLYDWVFSHRESLADKRLNKEEVLSTLFPDKQRKSFLNLMSRLSAHIVEYMAWGEFQLCLPEVQLYQYKALQRRGLYDQATKKYKKLIEMIDSGPIDMWDQYYMLRAHHELKYSSNAHRLEDKEATLSNVLTSWLQLVDDMSHFYTIDGVQTNKVWSLDMAERLEEVASHMDESHGKSYLADLHRWLAYDDHQAHEDILQMLTYEQLTHDTAMFILLHLVEKEQMLIRDGKHTSVELSRLFNLGVDNGWLLVNGQITVELMNLMIHSSCQDVDRKLARQYFKKWTPYLEEHVRGETKRLNEAVIHFYDEQYEQAVDAMRGQKFTNKNNRLSARALYLMCFYMLYPEDVDFVSSQIKNYKAFIHRQGNISDGYKKSSLNFAKAMSHLLQLEYDSVRIMIENCEPIIRKYWLKKHLESIGF